ncbi:MAG: ATP-binding cassette domain-containing protein [Lachnospiraceae bacterium]|nr:ATP-binding cassette domain-containing protein [Lachnospiraceae bacterium]
MNVTELPIQAKEILESNGIAADSVVAISPFDLTFAGEYTDGYVVLTRQKLAIINSNMEELGVRLFKGVTKTNKDAVSRVASFELKVYERKELSGFKVEHMVATNRLCAVKGDELLGLAACTNLYLEEINHIRDLLKLLDKDENAEIVVTKEDKGEEDEELYCPHCHTKYPDPKRKICPKCMNKRSIFLRCLGYYAKYMLPVIGLFICYILAAVLNIAWPYLSGTMLYDYVLGKNNEMLGKFGLDNQYVFALILLVIVMLGAKLLQLVTSIAQGTMTARLVTKTVRDMKKDVFASLESLSLSFYTSKQTGSLMTRVLRDADRVTGFFIDGFPYIFINSFTIIATFTIMFMLNWKMSLVAIVLVPLLVVMSIKLKPALWSLHGRRHRAESAVNSRVNDNLTGARVVRAFGQQNQEIERFEAPNDNLRDAEVRIVRYNNKFTLLYEMVQEISSIWVWALGVMLLLNWHSISFGVLITFVGYIGQLNGPMRFFSWVFRMWSDSINAAQRMFEIMDAVPEVVEKTNPIPLENPKGEIVIKDMTFGYDPNHPVLKNINLHVKPGEMLGIVGHSGAGKTTLVNLLSRLYDVNTGSIEVDGIDVRDLSFKDLRRNIAMVSQDTYIFMGSVADNIAYADENATRAQIIEAARLAGAHDFISKMPDGYDTIIGASGKSLSGGERQRLSIARAIIANPKILILDEATASVDTKTEKAIQAALNILVQGRTTLSIAHRLSTLRDANHLIVIEKGRIEEEGTRQELEELGGIYHKLAELQTKSLALKGIEED